MEEKVQQKIQLNIEIEPLKSRKLMIATPCYGGNLNMSFDQSQLQLQSLLMRCGIEHTFIKMGNESLISRGRNKLANYFLQTDYTDLMWIDSDIEFSPTDVIALLHFNKDVIGGNYPMKGINWEAVKAAVKLRPDISPEDLEKCGARWTGHFIEGTTQVYPFVPVEVTELATGFMMTSRKVYETLKDKVPNYDRASNETDVTPTLEDYFQVGVHERRYESEDYSLCREWREAGGKIYCCPWMALNHCGTHTFKGDLNRVIEILGVLH